MDDNDLSNNRDYYYLSDAMGGHVGVLADVDGDLSTPGQAAFATYDAFGNRVTQTGSFAAFSPLPSGEGQGEGATSPLLAKSSEPGERKGSSSPLLAKEGLGEVDQNDQDQDQEIASVPPSPGVHGSFAWRGREGSISDIAVNLVYMQARHYDPELGRFIQPDSNLMASNTTQGMNRYVYTENDPVNRSDPSGQMFLLQIMGLLLAIILPLILAAIIAPQGAGFVLGTALRFGISCILREATGVGLLGWIGIFLGLLGLGLLFVAWPVGLLLGVLAILLGLVLFVVDFTMGAVQDRRLASADNGTTGGRPPSREWRWSTERLAFVIVENEGTNLANINDNFDRGPLYQ